MTCDFCGKRKATVHLTEIINNKVTEVHLCDVCAKKKTDEFQKQFSMADLLSGLSEVDLSDKQSMPKLKCSNCGLTYHEFQKQGKLGCASCYENFKNQLQPLLKKIHGVTQHKGKFPAIIEKEKMSSFEKIKRLKNELEKAVQKEEYEEAARIRDKIKELRNK